jgi:hypothetical protein
VLTLTLHLQSGRRCLSFQAEGWPPRRWRGWNSAWARWELCQSDETFWSLGQFFLEIVMPDAKHPATRIGYRFIPWTLVFPLLSFLKHAPDPLQVQARSSVYVLPRGPVMWRLTSWIERIWPDVQGQCLYLIVNRIPF